MIGLAFTATPASPAPLGYVPGEFSGADPEFANNMASCLADAGWEVQVDPDNSYGLTIPNGQEDAYDAAEAACSAELGYDEEIPPLNDSEKKRLYRALQSLSECLESQGHTISERPSEQAFLDDAVFDPYGEIRNPRVVGHISDAEYYELLEVCPSP